MLLSLTYYFFRFQKLEHLKSWQENGLVRTFFWGLYRNAFSEWRKQKEKKESNDYPIVGQYKMMGLSWKLDADDRAPPFNWLSQRIHVVFYIIVFLKTNLNDILHKTATS